MATLKAVFSSLFPDSPNIENPFSRPPLMPTDIFAFVGHLLERSGAYHHIAPEVRGEPDNAYRRIVVDEAVRKEAVRVGKLWRTTPLQARRRLPTVPAEVEQLWHSLDAYGEAVVFRQLDDEAAAPEWWSICLVLAMICDEACENIGFEPNNPSFRVSVTPYQMGQLPNA
jgi:hypothetical protein